MANVFDVAAYIVARKGQMTAMKLQKLLYYCQAWNLVWEEEPLFENEFRAWANGPVAMAVYRRHRGSFKVDSSFFTDGDAERLSDRERGNIELVLEFYGDRSAQWLSNLTHQEEPWLKARNGLEPGTPSDAVISKASIYEYYSSL